MEDVLGQSVVLDDAPELRLVSVHDGEVIIMEEFVAVCRFTFAHVGLAMLLDDFGGNPYSYLAIEFSIPIGVELVVGLLVYEFIAEELGRLAGGMSYEGLIPG